MTMLQGDLQLHRLEADVAAHMERLFQRYPALYGFSLQHPGSVTRERVAQPLAGDLLLADLTFHRPLGGDEAAFLVEEISTALLELLEERPEAFELLRGHAFARALH